MVTSVGVALACWILPGKGWEPPGGTESGTTLPAPWWLGRAVDHEVRDAFRFWTIGMETWRVHDTSRDFLLYAYVSPLSNWRPKSTTAGAAGWPVLCFRFVQDAEQRSSFYEAKLKHETVRPSSKWWTGRSCRGDPIPTDPIPLGLAANTAFYAAIWALPLIAWPEWRMRRRNARGLCMRCAYPVAGLEKCPECGRAAAERGAV